MNYKGELYGKVGKDGYFQLMNTSEQFDKMLEALKVAESAIATGISISLNASDLREFIDAQHKIETILIEIES